MQLVRSWHNWPRVIGVAIGAGGAIYIAARLLSSHTRRATFDMAAFQKALDRCGGSIGREMTDHRDSVTSTMTIARESISSAGESGPPYKALFLADEQTSGSGRRGRSWESSGGRSNLYFTFLWDARDESGAVSFRNMVRINQAVGIAVTRGVSSALESCPGCPNCGGDVARPHPLIGVKWPNDVILGGLKVSGALVDFDASGCAVIGIGVNVGARRPLYASDEYDDDLGGIAIGIEDARSPGVEREALLARILSEFESLAAMDHEAVRRAYEDHSVLRGKTVRVHHRTREEDDPRDYNASVLGIAADGRLLVRRVDTGETFHLSAEEVSVRPGKSNKAK